MVRQMQAAFAAHWLETGGVVAARAPSSSGRCPAGDARAGYVTSMDVAGLSHARWVTHIALMAARRRALDCERLLRPAARAARHAAPAPAARESTCGCCCRGRTRTIRRVTFFQRRLYPRLERGGVNVYEYQPSMMHAKTMLVDDRLVVVGSINLDFLSMEWLEEGCLVVDDRPFAADFEQRWRDDLARSRQVTCGASGWASDASPLRSSGQATGPRATSEASSPRRSVTRSRASLRGDPARSSSAP